MARGRERYIPPEVVPLLGKHSDISIAESLGVNRSTVMRWRKHLGIPMLTDNRKRQHKTIKIHIAEPGENMSIQITQESIRRGIYYARNLKKKSDDIITLGNEYADLVERKRIAEEAGNPGPHTSWADWDKAILAAQEKYNAIVVSFFQEFSYMHKAVPLIPVSDRPAINAQKLEQELPHIHSLDGGTDPATMEQQASNLRHLIRESNKLTQQLFNSGARVELDIDNMYVPTGMTLGALADDSTLSDTDVCPRIVVKCIAKKI